MNCDATPLGIMRQSVYKESSGGCTGDSLLTKLMGSICGLALSPMQLSPIQYESHRVSCFHPVPVAASAFHRMISLYL
jgi:hypothetical protein